MPFCPPSEITIPPDRFREITVDSPSVIEMAESIKEVGQLQPALTTKDKILIDGATRVKACERLGRDVWWEDEETAKLVLDNPLLRKVAEYQANFVRKDFTPQQSAIAIERIHSLMVQVYGAARTGKNQTGWTQQDTAEKLGYKNAGTVCTAMQVATALKSKELPALETAKTMQEAAKIVKDRIRIEAAQEMARRQAEKTETEIEDPVKYFGDRIVLGDCLEKIKELPKNICSLVITDPPFGLSLDKIVSDRGESLGQAQTVYSDKEDIILQLVRDLIPEISRVCKPSCQVVMFCAVQFFHLVKDWFIEAGFKVYQKPLIWVKMRGTSLNCGRVSDPSVRPGSAYEGAVYAWRGGAVLAKQGLPDVFIHPFVPSIEKFHIAQKPISLMEEIIDRFYHPDTNPLLIDPFAGSGSTLVAARRLGIKQYLGFELDPEFRERAISFMVQSYLDDMKAETEVDLEEFV